VLGGHCWLHRTDGSRVQLAAGDAVFLLRDLPHALAPREQGLDRCRRVAMRPLEPAEADGTGLACGFFEVLGPTAGLLAAVAPECLVFKGDAAGVGPAQGLFRLILGEAQRCEGRGESGEHSALIVRLVEALFLVVVRRLAAAGEIADGLRVAAARPGFSTVIERLLREPARDWSVEEMARLANMSRTNFFKHFVEQCGEPPGRFLQAIRMRAAAHRLRSGDSVLRAAEHVGYHSQAAFSRAFTRVIGGAAGRLPACLA